MEIESVTKEVIKHITSCTISESRRILLITTANGFVLTDLLKMQYIRYAPVHTGSKANARPSASPKTTNKLQWDL